MDTEKAHEYSSNHRELILKSEKVGCFCCLRIYRPNKIEEWIDDGQTAVCSCLVDAVLPDIEGMLDHAFLKAMNRQWFSYTDENGEIELPNGKNVIEELA